MEMPILHIKWIFLNILIITCTVNGGKDTPSMVPSEFNIDGCRLVIRKTCPDPDIQFFLYTRENPIEPQLIGLIEGTKNLTASNFNPKHKTKIIIHGFDTGMHLEALEDIRKEYLTKAEHNIIAVNWPKLSMSGCYFSASINTRYVGKCTAEIVQAIRHQGGTDIHVLGFSLGAHAAGFTADNLIPYKLPRITGLDPAAPLFETYEKGQMLDASDAVFVDVIHTNAWIEGRVVPSGHVDFYVDGGTNQLGCSSASNFDATELCNHRRAPTYFAESINSVKGFYGWHCKDFLYYFFHICPPTKPLVIMGDQVPTTARGIYSVKTASAKPFALGPVTSFHEHQ